MQGRKLRTWLVIDDIERLGSPWEPSLIVQDTSYIFPHTSDIDLGSRSEVIVIVSSAAALRPTALAATIRVIRGIRVRP